MATTTLPAQQHLRIDKSRVHFSHEDDSLCLLFEEPHGEKHKVSLDRHFHSIALRLLDEDGYCTDEVQHWLDANSSIVQQARFYSLLRILCEWRALRIRVSRGGASFADVSPTRRYDLLDEQVVLPDSALTLHKHHVAQFHDGGLLLESPDAKASVDITCRDLIARISEVPPRLEPEEAHVFFAAGLVVPHGGADGGTFQASWGMADRLQFSRTRSIAGRRPSKVHPRDVSSPPIQKTVPHSTRPPLALHAADFPKTDLLKTYQDRRSIREYGRSPITLSQLGAFLTNLAGDTGVESCEFSTQSWNGTLHLPQRPYPASGGIYSTEIYAAVKSCDGLAEGLYWFNSSTSNLHPLDVNEQELASLVRFHQWPLAPGVDPQVLLVITAHVPLKAWKYDDLMYSLIQRDVGVLYQSMYLLATALGLAPCALGFGDSEEFARLIKIDSFQEPAVGEFLLGSSPD